MKHVKFIFLKAFIVSLLLFSSVVALISHQKLSYLEEILHTKRERIIDVLDSSLKPLKLLTQIEASRNKLLTKEEFQFLAKAFYDENHYSAFVYIFDDAIQSIYPEKYDADLIGINNFENEIYTKAADNSILYAKPFFAGPFEFVKNNQVFLVFYPLFIKNEMDINVFQGFLSASINILDVIKDSSIFEENSSSTFEHNLTFKIAKRNINISSDNDFFSLFSVKTSFLYENIDIELKLAYTFSNFISLSLYITIFAFIYVFALLIFYILLPYNRRFLFVKHKEYYDILTNVYTKRKLIDFINTNDKIYKQSFTLLYVDIDNFKHINDAYGNHVGDNLLIEFVDRLKNSINLPHSIVRLNADKFIILLKQNFTNEKILELEFFLSKLLREKFEFDGNVINITVRISHASYPTQGKKFTELLSFLEKRLAPK